MEDCSKMSTPLLFKSLESLAKNERRNLPRILARLAELDKRDAAARDHLSLFRYCLRRLRWSESDTAKRIHAARKAARYPAIHALLARGRLNMSTLLLIAPHLTDDNHRVLIARAENRSVRDVEALVAAIAPKTERAERIRPLGPQISASPGAFSPDSPSLFADTCPAPAPSQAPPVPEPQPIPQPEVPLVVAPPTPPSRVELTFTVDEALARDAEDARALLRNKYPYCRLEDVFREALVTLLARLDPSRRPDPAARPGARKPGKRRIPPAVRAYVWKRDKGRCAYVGPGGERCGSRAFLEFDHIRPFSLGGRSDTAENVRLLCRSHNIHMSRRVFGFI